MHHTSKKAGTAFIPLPPVRVFLSSLFSLLTKVLNTEGSTYVGAIIDGMGKKGHLMGNGWIGNDGDDEAGSRHEIIGATFPHELRNG